MILVSKDPNQNPGPIGVQIDISMEKFHDGLKSKPSFIYLKFPSVIVHQEYCILRLKIFKTFRLLRLVAEKDRDDRKKKKKLYMKREN